MLEALGFNPQHGQTQSGDSAEIPLLRTQALDHHHSASTLGFAAALTPAERCSLAYGGAGDRREGLRSSVSLGVAHHQLQF